MWHPHYQVFFRNPMTKLQKQIIETIKCAIDTDDLLELAILVEGDLPAEEIDELEKKLKELIEDNKLNGSEVKRTNQFFNFLY